MRTVHVNKKHGPVAIPENKFLDKNISLII